MPCACMSITDGQAAAAAAGYGGGKAMVGLVFMACCRRVVRHKTHHKFVGYCFIT